MINFIVRSNRNKMQRQTKYENEKILQSNKEWFKKIKVTYKVMSWLVIIGSLIMIVVTTVSILNHYKTYDLETKSNSTPMAEMDPSLLGLNNLTQAEKDFLTLYNQVMKTDGSIDATSTQAEQLNNYYNTISENIRSNYAEKYQSFLDKYTIDSTYKSYFDKNGDIKADVTPEKVMTFVNDSSKIINRINSTNKEDKFVKEYFTKLDDLQTDAYHLDQELGEFTKLVTKVNDTTYNMTPTITESDINNFKTKLTKLKYKWLSIAPLTQFLTTFNKPIKDMILDRTKFEEYQKDLADKETAYANWAQERETRKANYEYNKALQDEKARQEEEKKNAEKDKDKKTNQSSDSKTIPDLTKYSYDDAMAWLKSNNVKYQIQYQNDTSPSDKLRITGMTSNTGYTLTTDTTISLIVGKDS